MRRFTDEEKRQAIALYFDLGPTTKEVVDRLGYPTRQNLERWLSKDHRYGGNFRHGFYSVETKTKAVELLKRVLLMCARGRSIDMIALSATWHSVLLCDRLHGQHELPFL